MTVKTVDSLSLSTNVSKGIGLCYFDPETEQLNEFGTQEYLYITPFEENVRRYYLVKNSDNIDNKRPIFASVSIISNNSDIDIKVSKGYERVTDKAEFYDVEINNELLIFFNEYPSGIVPLDIYMKSNSNRNIDSDFNVKIVIG